MLAHVDRDVAEQGWEGGGGPMFGQKRRLKTSFHIGLVFWH